MLLGFFVAGGAASFGWVAYAPLSNATNSPGAGADLWIMALALTGFSAIFTGVNLVATIFYLRAPGMTMFRMPIFTWNMLVTGILILIAFPVLIAALVMLFCDRHFGTHIYPSVHGGGVHPCPLWQNLFWFFGHPEVYILALPYLRHRHRHHPGLLPQAGVRLQGHGLRHHVHRRPVHRACGPTTCSPPAWCCCRSSPSWPAHRRADRDQVLQLDRHHVARPAQVHRHRMLFCIGFLFAFLMGGVTGVMLASPPIDFFTHDTYFVVAHFHQVLFGTAVFAGFAGFYFWYPKMFGRMLRRDASASGTSGCLFIGFWVTFMPQYVVGLLGHAPTGGHLPVQPRLAELNVISTIGAFIIGVSFVFLLVNLVGVLAQTRPGRRQPLGRPHARVVHHVAAAAPQLHPPAADPLGAADLGLQPPGRARRPPRHAAEAPPSPTESRRCPSHEGRSHLPAGPRRLLRHRRRRLLVHQLRGRPAP